MPKKLQKKKKRSLVSRFTRVAFRNPGKTLCTLLVLGGGIEYNFKKPEIITPQEIFQDDGYGQNRGHVRRILETELSGSYEEIILPPGSTYWDLAESVEKYMRENKMDSAANRAENYLAIMIGESDGRRDAFVKDTKATGIMGITPINAINCGMIKDYSQKASFHRIEQMYCTGINWFKAQRAFEQVLSHFDICLSDSEMEKAIQYAIISGHHNGNTNLRGAIRELYSFLPCQIYGLNENNLIPTAIHNSEDPDLGPNSLNYLPRQLELIQMITEIGEERNS